MGLFSEILNLLRPRNAISPVLAYLLVYSLFSTETTVATVTQAVFVIFIAHSIATLHNDIQDFDIDKQNQRKSVLLDGGLLMRQANQLLAVLFVLLIAVVALSNNPPLNMAFASIFILLGWAYNSPPLQLSRRPVASIVILGLTLGFLPGLYGIMSPDNRIYASSIILVSGLFLVRCSTAILKDYKDIKGDKKMNKNTFLIAYGKRTTYASSILSALTGYILFVIFLYFYSKLSVISIWIIGGIFTLLTLTRLWLRGGGYEILNTKFKNIMMLTNVCEAGIALWLLY